MLLLASFGGSGWTIGIATLGVVLLNHVECLPDDSLGFIWGSASASQRLVSFCYNRVVCLLDASLGLNWDSQSASPRQVSRPLASFCQNRLVCRPELVFPLIGNLIRHGDGRPRDARRRFAIIISNDIPMLIYSFQFFRRRDDWFRDARRRFVCNVSCGVPRLLLA